MKTPIVPEKSLVTKSGDDLARLPLLSTFALAVRCARRLQPDFTPPRPLNEFEPYWKEIVQKRGWGSEEEPGLHMSVINLMIGEGERFVSGKYRAETLEIAHALMSGCGSWNYEWGPRAVIARDAAVEVLVCSSNAHGAVVHASKIVESQRLSLAKNVYDALRAAVDIVSVTNSAAKAVDRSEHMMPRAAAATSAACSAVSFVDTFAKYMRRNAELDMEFRLYSGCLNLAYNEVLRCVDPTDRSDCINQVHSDYQKLLNLSLGGFGDLGLPIDVSEDGPLAALWTGTAPEWYRTGLSRIKLFNEEELRKRM